MARAGYIILERDGFRCVYCGYSPVDGDNVVLTIDHIYPVALGGTDRADNLVACCESCNFQKQAKSLGPDAHHRLAVQVRERNQRWGILDHLIIDLGSISAEKRSVRNWQVIDWMLRETGDILELEHPRSSAGALWRIFALALKAIPEYKRLTGDYATSGVIESALKEMIANSGMAQKALCEDCHARTVARFVSEGGNNLQDIFGNGHID